MLSKENRHTSKYKLPLLEKFDQNRPSLRKNINNDTFTSKVKCQMAHAKELFLFSSRVLCLPTLGCPNTQVKEKSSLSPELLLLHTPSQKAFGSSWEVPASVANVLFPLILRISHDAELRASEDTFQIHYQFWTHVGVKSQATTHATLEEAARPATGATWAAKRDSCSTRRDPLPSLSCPALWGWSPSWSSASLSQVSLERPRGSQMSVAVGITFQTQMFLPTSFILEELS